MILKRAALFCLALVALLAQASGSASAATASQWKAGSIANDALFQNANDMSVADIQSFLNSKVPSCDTNGTKPASEYGRPDLTHAQYAASRGWPGPPYVCLRDYYEVPKTAPGPGVPANNFSGSIPAGSVSAAQMIYNAAHQYNISSRTLLIKLATESAGPLTSDTWPLQKQYTYAMGAHCPDSGPGGSANCDSNYAGFSIQIAEAAALLRYYLDNMSQPWWQYKKPYQTNSILWNVTPTGCGAGNVYIETKATAALYTYTPYQPNAAALANMYGTGDGCSAYGNRNFWRTWTDWFGPPNGALWRTTTSSSLYYVNGEYKFILPSMEMANQYGFGLSDVRFVSQQEIDSIPSAPQPLSGTLGQLVKSPSDSDADGGAVYFIDGGKAYAIIGMQQFNDFGFDVSKIRYLPLDDIQRLSRGDQLSNFIQSVDNYVVQVSGGKLHSIFEISKLNQLNPSGALTRFTNYSLGQWQYGSPQVDGYFVTINPDSSVRLYVSPTEYYRIPSMDVYNCLKLDGIKTIRVWSSLLTNGSALNTASCYGEDSGNTPFMLNGVYRYALPSGVTPSVLVPLNNAMLNSSTLISLKPVLKGTGPSLYILESGKLRYIPSYGVFEALGFTANSISSIPNPIIRSLPKGATKIPSGWTIISPNGTISLVYQDSRYVIGNMDQYRQFAFDTKKPLPVSNDTQSSYPSIGGLPYIVKAGSNVYLVDSNKKYFVDATLDTTYGINRASVATVDQAALSSLQQANLTKFVKSDNQSTVYYMENGTKRPIGSWQTLTSLGGSSSTIVSLTSSKLALYPTGSQL